MPLRWFLATLGLIGTIASAAAADLPMRAVVNAPVAVDGACANAHVLDRIVDRFAWAELKTWHRGFVMASIQNPRLSGHPFYEPGIIKREFCVANSFMSNGSAHTVFYAIEFGQGFASVGNYVDFCVVGLDPWHVHDEACRTVR